MLIETVTKIKFKQYKIVERLDAENYLVKAS